MGFFKEYEVIVVGAGHAGCEAAYAAGKMGSKTLLITLNMNNIAQMSCNPAVGGIAKGQIVREIDALGGMMGIVTDETMIQSKMLNRSKGPAMWSPRAQSDRMMFSNSWRLKLEQNSNVDFWQDMVTDVIVKNDKIKGVRTQLGLEFGANSVILTNGTFLNGKIHIGEKNFGGGRAAERASIGLTASLENFGFESGRMKTGTPPRVDARSLDFSKMEEQPGDKNPPTFSYTKTKPLKKQRSCWLTYTNTEVHDILKTGFEKSPMFSGRIQGLGPRYCPSIEDKIDRFSQRDRHQIFVEPEGWNTVEVYVNGFSTSLPEDVQYKALQKIVGFENAKMFRPGYAIEYDFFPPTQLTHTLETKKVEGLFFAGQINGTTGYEEAGAQGIIAGINAHIKVHNSTKKFILGRDQAYIGVLIDDLITKGTDEPYRMFTSRAEYRILLRQDNADERLTKLGYDIGLAEKYRLEKVKEKHISVKNIINDFKKTSIQPDLINSVLKEKNSSEIKQKTKAYNIVLRPQISIIDLQIDPHIENIIKNQSQEVIEQAEILMKYDGYISKEKEMVNKLKKIDSIKIKPDFNYSLIKTLSAEAVQKLTKIKPTNLGQASRVSGVSPSDISNLMIYLDKN
ncbi:MAG: tRNA uridine-5-carboxymethylaminomethyl(34) synthesis enzyme MnmG [Flavobacteriales bacterium]|nr:tRNA uridine-5-carboxymethylaminomethyl(34) synthesis enzyme MnmG [Flavobacteriales bacterium]|tara:strand:- start:15298 stop:17169 length:1872 start_codon:yes stop_codon:yes gene_type:complete